MHTSPSENLRHPFRLPHSKRQGAWRKQVASPKRNVTSPAVYNFGGPCVRGAKGGGSRKAPSPESLVTTCARHLETLNEIALTQIVEGSPNGLAVEYRQLPEVRRVWQLWRKLGKVVLWRKSTFWWWSLSCFVREWDKDKDKDSFRFRCHPDTRSCRAFCASVHFVCIPHVCRENKPREEFRGLYGGVLNVDAA